MNLNMILLIISLIANVTLLFIILKSAHKTQLEVIFSLTLLSNLICIIGQTLQLVFIDKCNPIYFDYFVYIGTCLLPVCIFFTGLIFENTKIHFKIRYLLLFVIPITSLLVLWTNNSHNLFYINYSVNYTETIYGPYFNYIHTPYSYILLAISILYLIRYSIKNSGLFSKQSLLIVLGVSIPLVINLLGSFKIIPMSIYITPISFSVSIFCFAFAMFKFDFLKVTPIALQRIVDRISDNYVVLNENNVITDFNETFLTTFGVKATNIRNKDIATVIQGFNEHNIDINSLLTTLDKVKSSNDTYHYEKHFESVHKHFNIEINDIRSNGKYVGTLILLKDITQHIEDMKTIKKNQDMLVEKERLASLGQLVGGIAHNLKTPIMSIAGATEGLTDLVKEYDSSIGDPEVNEQDHHEIASDMSEWIEKIKTHTSYMSDIITAVKGQAVTLNEDEEDKFTINELVKRVNILMKHELKNALIDMNINMNIDDMISLNGNVNSLVQVINNIISNAIQAYNGETNKSIDLNFNKNGNNIVISVQDYGCGMSSEVKDKLFKEMITTKGKNGTGLGLFMSYSTIRGHFNGDITFDSEPGHGTKFNVILPL